MAEVERATEPWRAEDARFVRPETPIGALAVTYCRALLARDRAAAAAQVREALDSGLSLEEVYLGVFEPVQYEIGWLWQKGVITVAHEHYCTNATQVLMASLYSRMFTGTTGGRRLLACCVQGELHELGLRMVSDLFELGGWDTSFLGANMPEEAVVAALDEWRPDVLAVGVTMHFQLERAERLIRAVRAAPRGRRLVVLVGGYSPKVVKDVCARLGADGTAPDARAAIETATRLVEHGRT